ncbi:HEPN domain-containing protein [Thiorhodococcus minor]|uniref:HEPN domain-containing protein n=1 Tax=Thiorhodococcus minor TaxID=57489 RepID=A0A6M0K6U2_9GAMM|nr:HEPN domain-containing protein [Thiorhodococcus minor]
MSPDLYLDKSRRALASARLLLEDGDTEGACNRAYYAMFDAAHAALLAGVPNFNTGSTKTHRGLIAALGRYLIVPGHLPDTLGRALNQVERIRLLADYTGEGIDASKARWAIEQAAEFLSQIEASISIDR